MAGELITTDWQMEYRDLLMGDSTNVDLVQIDGLLDLQEMVTSDRSRLQRHGLHPGDDFLTGRAVTITLELWAETQAELASLVSSAQRAFSPGSEAPMVFQIPGVADGDKARLYVRARRRTAPITLEYLHHRVSMVVEVYATDPRIYSNLASSLTAGVATVGTGLSWPLSWPLDWGTAGASGALQVTNGGSFESLPLLRIDGPVTNPYLENRTTDSVFRLNIDLPQDDHLIVDSENRTILLNGTASRYNSLVQGSAWPRLVPGLNELVYRAESSSGDSTATVTWRSAWV